MKEYKVATSPNRAYLATVLRTSFQIPPERDFRYARNVIRNAIFTLEMINWKKKLDLSVIPVENRGF